MCYALSVFYENFINFNLSFCLYLVSVVLSQNLLIGGYKMIKYPSSTYVFLHSILFKKKLG